MYSITNTVDLSDLIKFIGNAQTELNAKVLRNKSDYRSLSYISVVHYFSYPGQPVPMLQPLKRNLLLLHLGIKLRLVLKIKTFLLY